MYLNTDCLMLFVFLFNRIEDPTHFGNEIQEKIEHIVI